MRMRIPGDQVDPNGGQFQLLPNGWHDATIDTSKSEVKTAQSGSQYITVRYNVPFVPEPGAQPVNITLFDNLMVEGGGVFRAVMLCKAAGIPVEKGKPLVIDTDDLHGRHVQIRTAIEEYEGNRRSKVKEYDAPTGRSAAVSKATPFEPTNGSDEEVAELPPGF